MRNMRYLIAAGVVSVFFAAPSSAQDGWSRFRPETRHFTALTADPLEPRFTLGILQTNLLAAQGPERPPFALPDPVDSSSDVVAAVGLGLNIPLAALAVWEDGGISLT